MAWNSSASGGYSSGFGGPGGHVNGTGNYHGGGSVGRSGSNRVTTTSTSRTRATQPRTTPDRPTANPRDPNTPPANPILVRTLVGGRFDNGVLDVSIIPWMRSIDVQFYAQAMRPQRRIYSFFDNVDVNNYILKPNFIQLASNVRFTGGFSNTDTISFSSNAAQVMVSERNPDTGNTVLQVANVRGTFVAGQTITGSRMGNTAVIVEYVHCSGTASAGAANTITLQADAATMANNYWGTNGANTIYLVSGTGQGQNATITGFDNNSRRLSITGTWTTNPAANTRYSIGSLFVSRVGTVAGTFVIPATNEQRFRTGERIFRLIDISTGDVADCSTRADYHFIAEGLTQIKNEIIIQQRQAEVVIPPPPTAPANPPRDPTQKRDPVAQTFFVDSLTYPNGVFVTSIDLFFRTKDDFLPVWVELRPVVNGFPAGGEMYVGSEVTVQAVDVKVSETPNVADPATATTFTFPMPVWLEPGEHAIVVQTPSLNYDIFVSELGEKILGTNRIVSEQPYLGSFFKSQNASTWTPTQLEDLMFVLRKARFSTSGTVLFKNVAPTSNIAADILYAHVDDEILPNTSVSFRHSTDTGFSFANTTPDTDFIPTSRVSIDRSADGTYQLEARLATDDTSVSPILWQENFLMLAIENIINNANISNLDISITSTGNSFDANANVAVTINDGGLADIPATIYALGNATGNIASIIVTDGGEGYINTASLVISGANGANATAVMTGETSSAGGPGWAKYISRIVTLSDGFEAGDLRCFLTAFKPSGTQIEVYYKIRHTLDPKSFDEQPYVRMVQATPASVFSVADNDVLEYEYRPSMTQDFITYTSGTTTYATFNQYAIKIVLLSDNTVKYPVCYDLRAIALPSSEI